MAKDDETLTGPRVRLAELMAALSLATDIGTGQPMEHAIRSCILAVRLGEACGLNEEQLTDVYYLALLRYIGCTTENHLTAQVFGDEIAFLSWSASIEAGGAPALLGGVLRYHGAAEPIQRRAQRVLKALVGLPKLMQTARAHCEVGQQLAARIGLNPTVQHGLTQVHEYWAGRGLPNGLKGEEISLPVRVIQVATDTAVFHRLGGIESAVAVARKRSGKGYDPNVAERFCAQAARLFSGIDAETSWDAVLEAEPGPRPELSGQALDEAIRAFADFADLKSPYLAGHSSAVGELAASAAERCRLPQAEVTMARRAGMLHEVGQVGISAAVWDKPGPLTPHEWERVRLHPYFTERILARPRALAQIGAVASLHHERADGSGYHRGATARVLFPSANILAAACLYQTKTSSRPHRAAMGPEAVAQALRDEVQTGRLDGQAVEAVLVAAGHRGQVRRREWPSGLSDREGEVLGLLAKGLMNKQMARQLSVSEKTVDTHIQHIYGKIGVSTRAAATLFAMQHDLLRDALLQQPENQVNT